MRIVAFHQSAFEQYNDWAAVDKKMFERLRRLIIEAAKTPFGGIGKPELLKGTSKDIGRAASMTSTAWCIRSPINKSSSFLASTTTNDPLSPSLFPFSGFAVVGISSPASGH